MKDIKKVEILYSSSAKRLQGYINKFIEDTNITVIDIKFNSTAVVAITQYKVEYSALLIYIKN